MDALPLTSNGKLDEQALPPPDRARPDLGVPYVPPRTALEGELVALWSDLLAIAPVGVHDSFFDLGGDSLSAAWLAARLRRKPGVEVAVQALLAAPTVAELARMIEERPAELPVVADGASPVPDLDALRAANDHLHRTLLAAPVVDASDAGTHPSWYLAHDMRMAVMVRVAFGNASVAAISAAFSSLLVAQPLLRSVLERRGDETLFVEHAAVPVGALPVIDGEIGGIEAAMRRWMAEGAMDGRILFRVALVRAGDGVTLLLCLDHAVADHDCAWIVERQLRAALAGAPVGGGPTWRTFVEATRPSRSIGAIAAFKAHFRRYLDAVGALQARFPVGAPIVGSAPLHLEHESPENLAADVALWLAVQACRIQLGVEELPLRVLTSRRRFGRSLYYETLGDFHDSLPVMFDRPDLSGCNAQLRAVRSELASSGVYPSAMGRDPEVYERFFMSPANFNHLGEVSAGQERELLATAGPLSFVSYPVLAWSRGDRASVLLLHGLSPDGRTALEAGIGRIGGSFRIRALA
jgi:acyl carrier protein